jgi:molybdate transport system substrate-binding protein
MTRSRDQLSRRAILATPLAFSVASIAGVVFSGCKSKPVALRVAAASDLFRVLPVLLEAMPRPDNAPPPVITFGSTGKLALQIEQGAPFDVFLAAHERYLDGLESKGLLVAGTRKAFGLGRLSVVVPSPCRADGALPRRLEALRSEHFRRIAIAHPDHAPYGLAAREALQKAGVFDELSSRLVFADSVQHALSFVRTGNADVGIVARSLLGPDEACAAPVDPALHQPIVQAGAVLKSAKDPAKAAEIVQLLVGEGGRRALARGGFALPEAATKP